MPRQPTRTCPAMYPILLAVALSLSGALLPQEDVDPALLYVLAIEHLLRAPGEHNFEVVASLPATRVQVRARRASGEARAATAEDARRVRTWLARDGFRSRQGAGARLRLGLGELRLEPPQNATFARLTLSVSSTGGGEEVLEYLLKKERGEWRVLKAELEGSIGALTPERADRLAASSRARARAG